MILAGWNPFILIFLCFMQLGPIRCWRRNLSVSLKSQDMVLGILHPIFVCLSPSPALTPYSFSISI